MIIGDKTLFAIECEIDSIINNTAYGGFRFWANEKPIGEWEEDVHLFGCANWLYDFVKLPENRFEPELKHKSKEEIFFLLFDSFMPIATQENVKPPFKNTESRFHISHLGMSAFNRFDVLLVETESEQRLLWRDARDMVKHEVILPLSEIQRVAVEFCRWFAKEVSGYSFPKMRWSTKQIYPELPII